MSESMAIQMKINLRQSLTVNHTTKVEFSACQEFLYSICYRRIVFKWLCFMLINSGLVVQLIKGLYTARWRDTHILRYANLLVLLNLMLKQWTSNVLTNKLGKASESPGSRVLCSSQKPAIHFPFPDRPMILFFVWNWSAVFFTNLIKTQLMFYFSMDVQAS